MVRDGPGAGQPLRQRCHPTRRLQRITGGDQQPYLIQPQSREGEARDVQMPGMGGIEGTAEQADSAAPAVTESGNGVSGQGRTWPVPVMM